MSVNYLLKDKSAPQSDIKCNSVNVNRLSAVKVSAANVADASPITFIAPNGQVFSSIGTDTSITLSVALPAGWDAEGQRPNISTESSNPQELYSLATN
jgi:ABC-type enterobactin transport system permease subunit